LYCTDACAPHFDLIEATTFPRSKSAPCFAVPPPVPPMLRQPRDEPAVLGRVSEARVNDDVMVARRQPRASNASLASLTVRSQCEPVGSSFMSPTDSIDGTSVHSAKMRTYGRPI